MGLWKTVGKSLFWRELEIQLLLNFLFYICYLFCVLGRDTWVEVRRQFVGADSLFPPCGSWEFSGHQAWQQMPLPTEPSHYETPFIYTKQAVMSWLALSACDLAVSWQWFALCNLKAWVCWAQCTWWQVPMAPLGRWGTQVQSWAGIKTLTIVDQDGGSEPGNSPSQLEEGPDGAVCVCVVYMMCVSLYEIYV